jgi:NIPSNAP
MIPAAGLEWPHGFARNWLFRPAGPGSRLSAMEPDGPIVELRQYTLHPGARETLIRLFDAHFVEGQERCGIRVLGRFRDLDDPDRFVWLRGFPDMTARTRALHAFYESPIWLEHRPAANATMVDHTDVLLLRPRGAGGPLTSATLQGVTGVVALIDHLDGMPSEAVAAAARRDETMLAQLVTERAPNGYPRLPVREDANVLVTLLAVPAPDGYQLPSAPPGVRRREHRRLAP